MNHTLINIFQALINQTNNKIFYLKSNELLSEAKAHQFKVINFKKVLNIIKNLTEEITNSDQLKNFKGVGPGILKRIDEILNTGTLQELDTSSNNVIPDQESQVIKDLQRITGIGPAKAHKLYSDNITLTLLLEHLPYLGSDDEYLDQLTHHQLIGLKYFHDLEKRIPRKEISSIEKKLKKYCHNYDPKLLINICGSYRRGAKDSGDIDVLITHQDVTSWKDLDDSNIFLKEIIHHLTIKELLIDHLTNQGNTKYMGICQNSKKSTPRRIDIRFIPMESLAPAMLYFTGSGEFNKNMRTFALKHGYTINEYAIFKTKKVGHKVEKNFKIIVNNEKEIFELLKIPYLEPIERTRHILFNT